MTLADRIRLPSLNLIHRRKRLLNLLTTLTEAWPFITLYAPSGYGKTILLADFAQTTNLPVCWCSLEPADQDPTRFLTLLAYSLTDRFCEIKTKNLLPLITQGDSQASVDAIVDSIERLGQHLIIIDDYHQAVSPGLMLSLNRLVSQLPDHSTVILSSRCYANQEDLIRLPVGQSKAVLSERVLGFTPEEVQGVINKRLGHQITSEEATQLVEATQGNIGQILLTRYTSSVEPVNNPLQHQFNYDYQAIQSCLNNIFNKHSPEMQRFLLRTSLLPQVTVDIGNELLDNGEAQTFIEALVKDDLFVAHNGTGVKYQEFFKEFLQAKLAKDKPLYDQVARRSAETLIARRHIEAAVQIYLSLQAWDEVAVILDEQGELLYTGQAHLLHGWLKQLPAPILHQHPRLLLLKGRILCDNLGSPQAALAAFKQAESGFRQQEDAIGLAQIQILQSVVARMTGQVADSLTLAAAGLAQLETLDADLALIAWAVKNYALACWVSGDVEMAQAELRRALQMFEADSDTYRVGICHHDIGACLRRQGNIKGAEHHYHEAIRIWEMLGNGNDLTNTLNNLGKLLCIIGRYDEARCRFNNSLDIALQIGATRRAAFAQAGLGDTYLDNENYEQALAAYRLSTKWARQAEVRALEIYNMVRLGECFYRQQEITQALTLAHQAGEIAVELGLAYEKGLAYALQGRICTRQAQYTATFPLFEEALASFSKNDVLEQAKVRLWWGYSLFLDLRVTAALDQLQAGIRLALEMGDLQQGLSQAIKETLPLLFHFLHLETTPEGVRDGISMLLDLVQDDVNIAKPALQIFTLGIPRLIVAGGRKLFTYRGRTSRLPELIAYLALQGQVGGCRWDEISLALWPDIIDPDRASDVFHQSLRRLRDAVLETSEYIVVEDDYYQINPDYLEWCDVLAFEALYKRIVTLSPPEAFPLQLELINLYQGEFLAGFDPEQWGKSYRAFYENRFLHVVKLTSEYLLTQKLPELALDVLFKGLSQDIFREELHEDVLKAYGQLGLYSEIRLHYQNLSETLKQEFDSSPNSAIEALYHRLIQEEDE